MTIFTSSATAFTSLTFHGVRYLVDDKLNFYVLGADGRWHAVNANHVPDNVVEAFRSVW